MEKSLSSRLLSCLMLALATIPMAQPASLPLPMSWTSGSNIADLTPRTNNKDLRILCVGASITFGVGSTTGNGYRKSLREKLSASGFTTQYVGTQSSGNMLNNANEGYPGMRIDQVMGFAWNSYGYLPNVVLLHLGTNDFVQGYDPKTSADRMGILVDQIYTAIPSTTFVVVSKLLPNNRTSTEIGIEAFNGLLDDVVSGRAKAGKNVVVVDMHSSQFSIADLGPDGTHPTDSGYDKMAVVWHDAIVGNANKIQAPKSNGLTGYDDNKNCPFTSDGVSRPGISQYGFGNKTAMFTGSWQTPSGDDLLQWQPSTKKGIFWANLDGRNGDDFVKIDDDGNISAWFNQGDETFGSNSVALGKSPSCDLTGVRFADINGDGVADHVCIANDGSLVASITSTNSGTPSWGAGLVRRSSSGGFPQRIFVADMDGDGLADYIYVSQGGTVSVSYNRHGTWTSLYQVFAIPGFNDDSNSKINYASIQFIDINGDGRADCVNAAFGLEIYTWLNYAGTSSTDLNFYDSGIIKKFDAHANVSVSQMTFGIIRGTRKADLATLHTHEYVKLYENRGYNGVAYGARCRYCDMTGAGSDSYLSIGPSGSLKLYQNLHNGGTHLKYGEILGDQGLSHLDVHLADLDGDGKCDYVTINNQTGSVSLRTNTGVMLSGKTGSLSLGSFVSVSISNPPGCDSAGVRFADIDGNGLADYICITPLGNVAIRLNSGNGGSAIGFTKTLPSFSVVDDISTAGSRDSISFADIDGDGLADYLFFDTNSGTVTARLNSNKGQSFGDAQTIYYDPTFVGGYLRFANMNGLGRADMINIVNTLSAKAKTSSNRCPHPTPPTGIGPNPNPPTNQTLAPAATSSGNSTCYDDSDTVTATDCGADDDGSGGDEDDDDDYENMGSWQPCDYSDQYADLTALSNAAQHIRGDCFPVHTVQTLGNMLDSAYSDYLDVNNGYDQVFTYYTTYIKKMVPQIIAYSLMFNSSRYDPSDSLLGLGPGMQYFDCAGGQGGSDKFPCADLANQKRRKEIQDYPTTFSLRDHDGFYNEILSLGLDPSFISFGDVPLKVDNEAPTFNGATQVEYDYLFKNFPMQNSTMIVPNPKDIVTKGLGSVPAIRTSLIATKHDIMLGQWYGGSSRDAVDAYSMPVSMLMQAVDGMKQAKAIGQEEEQEEEAEEKRRKDVILLIISILLIFVPVVGEELAVAAGLATIARTIAIAGELGNAALAIYETVEEPSSAIMNIFGMLVGVGSIVKVTRDGPGFSDIAKLKRGMSADAVASFGKVFKDNDGTLAALGKFCKNA